MDETARALLKTAGYDLDTDGFAFETCTHDMFERFAAAIRAEALEEAAAVCDEKAMDEWNAPGAERCAAAIRALIKPA